MSEKLAKLVVQLEAQTARYQKDLEKANRKTKSFGRNTKKTINGVKAAFGALALGAFAKKVIDSTARQEQAFKQLEQGIKSTNQAVGFSAKELANYATELQAATTFGDEGILEAQSKLVTFTKITGDEFKRTTELALDMSARFGTDASAAAIQLGKALNDPIGNLSALSRAGIQFSKSQKDMIKSMVDSGNQVAAQKLILKELDAQFGGSARAARDTFGGALKGLSNAFGDLLESNGGLKEAQAELEKLTSVLSDPKTKEAADQLTSTLIAGFSKLVGVMADVPNFAKFLGESIAAAVHGGADLVRVQDEIKSKTIEITGYQNALNHAVNAMDKRQIQAYQSRIDKLNEELGLLKEKERIHTPTVPQLTASAKSPTSDGPTTTGDPLAGSNPTFLKDVGKWVEANKKQAEQIVAETTPIIEGLQSKLADAINLNAQGLLSPEQFEIAKANYQSQIDEIASKQDTDFQDRILRLEENFLSEQDFLQLQYSQELSLIDDKRAAEILGEQKHNELKLKLTEQFKKDKERLSQLTANAEINAAQFAAQSIIGIFGAFAGKSFKAQKALAIAEGIVNITAGVAKALNNPYPANLGFAAQVAAQGSALISTIKGTNPSGGGSIGSAASGGSFNTPPATNEIQSSRETLADQGNKMSLELSFTTDEFTEQPIRRLIEKIQDAGSDMGLEVVSRDRL